MLYLNHKFHLYWTLEIWDALRAAAEADLSLAQAIVDSAGVIVQSADLTICYDERGTYPICICLHNYLLPRKHSYLCRFYFLFLKITKTVSFSRLLGFSGAKLSNLPS